MAGTETGIKWWVKEVIVPVIGTGGVLSVAAVVLPVVLAQNAAKPAAATGADPPAVTEKSSGAATAKAASLDDQARTTAAHFVQAMLSEDHAALVDMVDEPVHITGKVHLTKLGLRCALEADRHKPLVPGMAQLAGQNLIVKRLATADLGVFPGAREGDYMALFSRGKAEEAGAGLQLHMRQRGTSFVVLRIVHGDA